HQPPPPFPYTTLFRSDRLRERPPRRQAPNGPREQKSFPPHPPLLAPHVSRRRRLPEGGARENEQDRAIEPGLGAPDDDAGQPVRSEEHTSELQSLRHL